MRCNLINSGPTIADVKQAVESNSYPCLWQEKSMIRYLKQYNYCILREQLDSRTMNTWRKIAINYK